MRKDSRSNATPNPISAVIEAEGTGVGVTSGRGKPPAVTFQEEIKGAGGRPGKQLTNKRYGY